MIGMLSDVWLLRHWTARTHWQLVAAQQLLKVRDC